MTSIYEYDFIRINKTIIENRHITEMIDELLDYDVTMNTKVENDVREMYIESGLR